MMSGKISLKTVIVLVILVLVGTLSVLGMETAKTYLSGASAATEPKSVLAVSTDDGKSASVTWVTDKPVQAVVEYGTTPASLLLRSLESDATMSHTLTLSPLKQGTSYYFRIRVGEEVFDNSGIPYSFKTKVGEAKPTMGAIKPTLGPIISVVPTIKPPEGECNRTTDYNKDGTINSMDFVKCIKDGPKTSGAPTIPTGVDDGTCKPGVDYDGNGIINSIDRIKCLQKKT
jgi:hypothetical protein